MSGIVLLSPAAAGRRRTTTEQVERSHAQAHQRKAQQALFNRRGTAAYSSLAQCNALRYIGQVIDSFLCKETRKIYNGQFSKKLPQDIQRRAADKLAIMDAACELQDLLVPPSNYLEALSGDRLGQHSIRINRQWRICFTWNDVRKSCEEVEITDYH